MKIFNSDFCIKVAFLWAIASIAHSLVKGFDSYSGVLIFASVVLLIMSMRDKAS